ncbi:MAG: hypothetical protein AAF449_06805 [Myxococcota bacterium]
MPPPKSKAAQPSSTAPWTERFDFDGDGINDYVDVAYTGGAHCCYRLSVRLSTTGVREDLPFELDGGYWGGLDLSRPKRFDVRKTDGVLPELIMTIEVYNGRPSPLPNRLTEKYGIRTHRVAVGFPKGRLRIRDWPDEIVPPNIRP